LKAFNQDADAQLNVTFPNDDDIPSGRFQGSMGAPITFGVAVELRVPKDDIRRGALLPFRALMTVPKAPMHEHRLPITRQHDIRPTRKIGPVKAKP
jgi:hypothetical protein